MKGRASRDRKDSPTRNRRRIRDPENDPGRADVADTDTDQSFPIHIICVLSDQPFQNFHSY